MACLAAIPGCLALDPVELPPQRDFPPSILDAADTPYPNSGIIELDFGADPSLNLELDVIVRDPNLDQTLSYAVFVDSTPTNANRRDAGQLAWTDDEEPALDRPLTITVEGQYLQTQPPLTGGSCHRVELLVSGEFDTNDVQLRRPLRPNDIASHVWWVRSISNPSDVVDLQSCPAALEPHFDPSAGEN